MLSAIAVIIILLMSSNTNILFQSTNDYGIGILLNTKSTNLVFSTPSNTPIKHDNPLISVQNSLNHNAPGELLDSDRYIVSWQPGEKSTAITAKVDFTVKTRYENLPAICQIILQEYISRVLFKSHYWWLVTYTDVTGHSTVVIDGRNFSTSSNSVREDFVHITRSSPYREFPNFGLVSSKKVMANATNAWVDGWYSPPDTSSHVSSAQIETDTLVFEMLGQRVGTVNVKCYLEDLSYAYQETGAFWFKLFIKLWLYQNTGPILLSEDNAYLPSGIGEVSVESLNAVKPAGDAKAGGTGIVYTKYVWEEGQNVTFRVKTGYSGTSLTKEQQAAGNTGGWVLRISNSAGVVVKSMQLQDGLANYRVTYQIPKGTFIPNDPNDNEWMVTLSNTLFDQSESRLFVVDSLAKIPGKAKATFDKNQYKQWDNVQVTISASANPAGTNDIKHFRVWVTYDGWTSTNYAYTEKIVPASLSAGGVYTATVNFDVALGDKNLYATTVAIDSIGRAGPEGEDQAYVEQVIPGEGIFDNIDQDTLYMVLAILGIIVAGGIALYVYQKRGRKKT